MTHKALTLALEWAERIGQLTEAKLKEKNT